MLKRIRRIAAALSFVMVSLLFLDFTGTLHLWFGWLAKAQLVPAVLAVNVTVIIILALSTLVLGRVYCSVVCPLGVMQDGVSWVSGRRKGKKARFRHSKAVSWLRYAVLALFIAALVAGVSAAVSLLDPYAAYGRIASNIFAPVYRLGNNLLAWFAERGGSYAFYSTEVWVKSGITLGIALLTLFVVGVLAWRNGRTYCNTVCPVGTFLGLLSRFSILRPSFDADKCTKCGVCERRCKSSCIDSQNMTIDRSRCVTCFNCVDSCKFGAMKYAPVKAGSVKTDKEAQAAGQDVKGVSRRSFLSIAGVLAFTQVVKGQQLLQADGGLADIEDKKVPDRKTPVVPPGAGSLDNMNARCTSCQLCVSSCPNHILFPSSKLSRLMQPEMSFERGYCRPECTECSQVCPAGAINPITVADKTAVSIGQAYWIKDNCVVNTDKLPCTACERHCPTGAIILVPIEPDKRNSLKIPTVNNELCIGCGACEYHCPARPFSAIYVEGNVKHHII